MTSVENEEKKMKIIFNILLFIFILVTIILVSVCVLPILMSPLHNHYFTRPSLKRVERVESIKGCLMETARVLEKEDIPYWLDSGTLLGAVRDGNIIPWDVDADIGMLKSDALRLLSCQHLFRAPYCIVNLSIAYPIDKLMPGLASHLPRNLAFRIVNQTEGTFCDITVFNEVSFTSELIGKVASFGFKDNRFLVQEAPNCLFKPCSKHAKACGGRNLAIYPKSMVFPLERTSLIDDRYYPIPFYSSEYLDYLYCEWKTPDHDLKDGLFQKNALATKFMGGLEKIGNQLEMTDNRS
jgi:hypothetical protein